MNFNQIVNKSLVLMAVIFVFAFASGCDNDLLNTAPNDRLSSETFWNSEEDAEYMVNDLYTYLPGTYTLLWDGMSDIAIPNNIWINEVDYVRGQQDGESAVGKSHWNNSYRAIRGANNFLANVDDVFENSETPVNEDLINRFKGEARVLRAFKYLQLVTVFGDVPLITTPISVNEGKEIGRTDIEQIWDFIETELEESAEVLEISYNGDDVGRITRGAALAIKSRAMLHAGRFTKAHEAASRVMDLGYSLYPSYETLFTYEAENNQEVILDKQFIASDYPNNLFALLGRPAMGLGESSAPVPTKNIVDAYEMANGMDIEETGSGYDPFNPYENRDPRMRYSMYVYGDTMPNDNIYDPRPGFGGQSDIERGQNTTNTGFNIQKYVDPADISSPSNGGINIIIMRYAEVLLNYAEAKIEDNQIDQSVYDAINEIRERPDVNMPRVEDTGQSQEEMREIVRHERMVELAFEGQRFFDIRRWGIADEVMNENNGEILGIEYENEDGDLVQYEYTQYRRNFESHHYVWPIPQEELNLSDNMSQNDNY
ncbi:MAG: RagB/SusD family nutrient uptake outer membrane protein [Balneolaceae bacterium]